MTTPDPSATPPVANPNAPATPPTPPQVGTPEYDQMMATRWATSNPEGIPEQYKTPEAYGEYVANLRRDHTKKSQELAELKAGTPPTAAPDPVDPATPPTEEPDSLTVPDPDATDVISTEGAVDWAAVKTEISSTGELSDASREALKTANIPDDIIEMAVAGSQARKKLQIQQASKVLGGSEQLESLLKWASKNLDAAGRDEINEQLNSPNWERALLGLQAQARRADPTSNEPSPPPDGDGPPNTTAKPFASMQEMTTAIRDPRYKLNIDGFRDMVEARVKAGSETRRH